MSTERIAGTEWGPVRYLKCPEEADELWGYATSPQRQTNLVVLPIRSAASFHERAGVFRRRVGAARIIGVFPSVQRELARRSPRLGLGDQDALVLRPLRAGERAKLPGSLVSASSDDELASKVAAKIFEEGLGAGPARAHAKAERQLRLRRASEAREPLPPTDDAQPRADPHAAPPHPRVTPATVANRFKPHKASTTTPPVAPVARRAGEVATEATPGPARRAVESSRTSYRAFWRIDGPVISTVRGELLAWLGSKRVPAALVEAESGKESIDGKLHRWAFDVGRSDDASALAFTLEQPTRDGTFTTEISAYEGQDGRSWVFVHVYNDADRFVDSPNIASSLIRALDIREAGQRLGVTLEPVSGVDALALLEDEQRRLPVVMYAVNGAPGEERYEAAVARARQWVPKLVGQAHLVLLDAAAGHEFNTLVARELELWPWSMRVYQPGFERDDAEQKFSHRYLSQGYLSDSDDRRVSGRLIGLVRAVAQRGQTPSEVRRAQRLLDRVREDREQTERKAQLQQAVEPVGDAVSHAHSPAELQLMAQLLPLVQSLFSPDAAPDDIVAELEDKLTAQDLAPRVEKLQTELDQTTDALEFAKLELQDVRAEALAETADLERQLERSKREASYYQQELSKLDAGRAYSYVDEDPVEDIDDIEIVLSRARGLAHVEVTWDEDVVRQIAAWDKNNVVPRVAWQALEALDAFAKAWVCGEFRGNFLDYAEQHEGFGPRKIAMQESNQTMKRWGKEREFRVPTSVDPSGVYRMQSHIRLCSQSGSIATRMYFLDDLAHTGKIYVGYLGEHLTNTQTANF